jgi:hypothetical protein
MGAGVSIGEQNPARAFDDVSIVDLDLKKTIWSRVHDSMRVMYLKLDRAPPDNRWIQLFQEERQSRIGVRRRGLWIEDDYISFDCLANEVETFHLPDIKLSINYANREYRKHLERLNERRKEQLAIEQAEAQALAELRTRVRQQIGAGRRAVALPAGIASPVATAARGPVPVTTVPPAETDDAALVARREQWRERFRAALNQQKKES